MKGKWKSRLSVIFSIFVLISFISIISCGGSQDASEPEDVAGESDNIVDEDAPDIPDVPSVLDAPEATDTEVADNDYNTESAEADNDDPDPNIDDSDSDLDSCGDGPLFTVSPINQEDFKGLVPLGNLSPPGHVFPTDHIYFYIRNTEGFMTAIVPVYAPGDITITEIGRHYDSEWDKYDYTLHFSACAEFHAEFLHMNSLDDSLLSQIDDFNEEECSTYPSPSGDGEDEICKKTVSAEISAGQTIGTAGGGEGLALDFGAYDSRVEPLDFVNPERFQIFEPEYGAFQAVCPIDYFADEVRTELEDRFGNHDGTILRTAEPICGTVMQDVPNTAQGLWYVEGSATPIEDESRHLALVHNNVDPSIATISVGTSIDNLAGGGYSFTPGDADPRVNVDFGNVSADGNTYCYEVESFETGEITILIKMSDSSSLTFEKQDATSCGEGPWSFTSNVVNFER